MKIRYSAHRFINRSIGFLWSKIRFFSYSRLYVISKKHSGFLSGSNCFVSSMIPSANIRLQ